ncbi:Asp-tRNA(Asn)/Glu-tRNA(Gln) amidotransferase GatCAB subunit B [archaeon]|nr:Asp-tRNA(Asn)/Glu-tRNA(Gln) amidotransferase GatCAB subunit B [archaeon]
MVKIGIEIHVQLNTESKLLCDCKTSGNEEPNTRTCEICTGQPGSKPTMNEEAFMQTIKTGLALNCKINSKTYFSRKNYFYPDLSKNIQVSQYEVPIAEKGNLDNIRIRRIHLEEDPGALIHKKSYCLVDYNRSGIPLIEIVTEPDFTSAEDVRIFLRKLITILGYLKIYTRRSEASMKADVNISTNDERVEVKNITGLKEIQRAIEYEILRQDKEPVKQRETRGWDADKGVTTLQRIKESEDDYGYITESDLPVFEISSSLLNKIKEEIPELPDVKIENYVKKYKIEKADAEALAYDLKFAELFEYCIREADPVLVARWLRRDLIRQLNLNKKTIEDVNLKKEYVLELMLLIQEKKVTDNMAKEILIKLMTESFSPKKYVEDSGLTMESDTSKVEEFCTIVLKENLKAVEDLKKGEEKALNFLVGKVMQISKKTANPDVIRKILKKLI